jgi:hypothetical protein
MMHETGDDTFLLGRLGELTYRQMMGHPTVRSLVLATNIDSRPDCVNCAYNPFCGVDGVHTYKTQGSIAGRMRESTVCMVHKGIRTTCSRSSDDPPARALPAARGCVRNRADLSASAPRARPVRDDVPAAFGPQRQVHARRGEGPRRWSANLRARDPATSRRDITRARARL